MNLHLTKEQFEILLPHTTEKYIVGSQYYGHASDDSDTDMLCIYDDTGLDNSILKSYGIFSNLQLQYKDLDNKIDYVFSTRPQFWGNLLSGDSQINLEVALFELEYGGEYFRSFKILRGLLGVAKRDLKASASDVNRLRHAEKMVFITQQIYNNFGIAKDTITNIFSQDDDMVLEGKELLTKRVEDFRLILSKDLDEGKLFSYSPAFINHLNSMGVGDPTSLIINNLNTINFKYD